MSRLSKKPVFEPIVPKINTKSRQRASPKVAPFQVFQGLWAALQVLSKPVRASLYPPLRTVARCLGLQVDQLCWQTPLADVAELEVDTDLALEAIATPFRELRRAHQQAALQALEPVAKLLDVPTPPFDLSDRRGQHWVAKRAARQGHEVVEYVLQLTEDKDTMSFEVSFNELKQHFHDNPSNIKLTSRNSLEARISQSADAKLVLNAVLQDGLAVVNRVYTISRLRPVKLRRPRKAQAKL